MLPGSVPPPRAVCRAKRRGFNLIESAVVLAVVGAVLGGIWIGAAAMIENYRVSKTVSDLTLLAKNVQGLISYRDSEAIGSASLTTTLLNAGAFPKDWVNGKTPWGAGVLVWNEISGGLGETNRFYIEIYNKLTPSLCVNLVTRLVAVGDVSQDSGLNMWNFSRSIVNIRVVKLDNSSVNMIYFPIPIDTVSSACNEVKELILYFPYTRIN